MERDTKVMEFRTATPDDAERIVRFWHESGASMGATVPLARVDQELGYPLVVKPNKQGSSVGLTVVRRPGELRAAVDNAYKFDDEVMLERFISGRELTVGIPNDMPLAGEIRPKRSDIFDYAIFDYASKYQEGGAEKASSLTGTRYRDA
jgi:D-alanine-D-alanine ligase-like ATP-grasp enzyme